jgi:hypothetical protein
VVCHSDILDILNIKPEVAHRGRPVEQRRETCPSQCFPKNRNLGVIDTERHDTKADHHSRV